MASLIHEIIADEKSHVTVIEFNADGSVMASSGFDTSIKLWETGGFGEIKRFQGHENCANAIIFDATGGISNDITFWSVPGGELLGRLPAHNGGIASMKFFSNQETLLTVGFDGEIKRWSRKDGPTVWQGELIRKTVKKGYYFSCLSPPEELLAVSIVRGILVIDTGTGEVVDKIIVKPKSLYSPRFHPDGKKLAAGAADRKIRVWRIDES